MSWRVLEGDCVELMAGMPEASVDAVVCDPPYGLEFMGKEWDRIAGERWERMDMENGPGRTGPRFQLESPRYDRKKQGGKPMQEWHERWATEAIRVLKPGGHLLAFGGTRTYHRLACAVEDAGFEIRDCLAWLYGSGFPKSLDVSKAIDKSDAGVERRARNLRFTEWMRSTGITAKQIDAATSTFMGGHYLTSREQAAVPTGDMLDKLRPLLPTVPEWVEQLVRERTVESENFKRREVTGEQTKARSTDSASALPTMGAEVEYRTWDVTAPHTPEAERWQGWGTALKPAHEPIVMARKPLSGTVAQTILEHGTGALNVDACRIETDDDLNGGAYSGDKRQRDEYSSTDSAPDAVSLSRLNRGIGEYEAPAGRWPANVVLDEQAAEMLDEQTGEASFNPAGEFGKRGRAGSVYGGGQGMAGTVREERDVFGYGDRGGASRFLYVAKSSAAERSAGLGGVQEGAERNSHPT